MIARSEADIAVCAEVSSSTIVPIFVGRSGADFANRLSDQRELLALIRTPRGKKLEGPFEFRKFI